MLIFSEACTCTCSMVQTLSQRLVAIPRCLRHMRGGSLGRVSGAMIVLECKAVELCGSASSCWMWGAPLSASLLCHLSIQALPLEGQLGGSCTAQHNNCHYSDSESQRNRYTCEDPEWKHEERNYLQIVCNNDVSRFVSSSIRTV